jgi:hypothetical protein
MVGTNLLICENAAGACGIVSPPSTSEIVQMDVAAPFAT